MSKPGFYKMPKEVWDADRCEELANRRHRDGLGTPYPWKGYVGHLIRKTERYNGGTIIDGKWYQGVEQTLPDVAEGYKLINVLSWGLRLVAE